MWIFYKRQSNTRLFLRGQTTVAHLKQRSKYLTKMNFLKAKKRASTMEKYILDSRYLIKKGFRWILGNGYKNKFWHDVWIVESPLMYRIFQEPRLRIFQ